MAPVETVATRSTEELLNSLYLQELARQMRAQDSYGTFRSWSNELVLKPFVVSKEQKRKISVDGDVEPVTKLRIASFYRAVAARVEQETGLICQVVIDLSHEGFGWALVFCGRLLVVARTLRDAQRFGYESFDKLEAEGEKLTTSAVELATRHREVAKI